MADTWQIRIYDQQQTVYSGELSGIVELGRQADNKERVYSKSFLSDSGITRLVVAHQIEDSVSRHHALLEPSQKPGHVRIKNLSSVVRIQLQGDMYLDAQQTYEIPLPVTMILGKKLVRILEPAGEELRFEGLREATAPGAANSGQTNATPSTYGSMTMSPQGGEIGIEDIIDMLKATMGVLQSAVTSSDFFDKAARAIVDNVGLDSGRVVLLHGEDWRTQAAWAASGQPLEPESVPSRHVLARVRQERRTLWHVPTANPVAGIDSLANISAVVASPILNERGVVIGAMYGDRRRYGSPGQPPKISKLDAMLVDVLAASVAAGLARMEGEKAALAARVQFEQFFTPELARQIANRPELLDGQESEITLLFCDIRGFSRFSERLGPAKTVKWINEVMSVLSDCVLAHRGVLVDYIGDELMAMWGAPEEQPDHATLACRAALDMIKLLPEMNERFLDDIGEAMDLGIGINTGVARVGNTGSKHKFKYGPLGNTVNLASRVQGVTKYMKVRLLVTEATYDRLGPEFVSRRLGLFQVVNINEPVTLYEVNPTGDEPWEAMRFEFESALAEFERKGFRMAARILGAVVTEHPDDGPSMVLLSRVVNSLIEPASFNPVFILEGK